MRDPRRELLYYLRIGLMAGGVLGFLLTPVVLVELYKTPVPLREGATLLSVRSAWHLICNILPGILAISAACFLACSFVKSLYDLKSRWEAFDHIQRCILGQSSFAPFIKVEDGRITMAKDVLKRIGGPCSLLSYKDTAVVLEQGGRLTRVIGPGTIAFGALGRFEKVRDVIDLRPMRWEYRVLALSKEGIEVTLSVEVHFQIDTGGREPTDRLPFPALDEAVFKASISRWMRDPELAEDDQSFDWARRVIISETEGILRSIVARYPLDALVGLTYVSPGKKHPRKAILEELTTELKATTFKLGVQINDVQLGNIEVGDEVTRQWVEVWQRKWQDWALVQQEAGEARREQLLERAQAQAQVDMIMAVAQTLQSVSEDARTRIPSQLLVMRLIDVFDRFSADPSTRLYLPRETIYALKELRELVAEKPAQRP